MPRNEHAFQYVVPEIRESGILFCLLFIYFKLRLVSLRYGRIFFRGSVYSFDGAAGMADSALNVYVDVCGFRGECGITCFASMIGQVGVV